MSQKTLLFDSAKCVGCYACAVACMDQNDLDVLGGSLGSCISCASSTPLVAGCDPAYRRITHVEREVAGEVHIAHVSTACQHCENAECLDACPSGALRRDLPSGAVTVRRELCIGCHACAMACPFGVPRFGRDGTMQKCDGCYARVRFGYEPACSDICPTGALSYVDANEAMALRNARFAASLAMR